MLVPKEETFMAKEGVCQTLSVETLTLRYKQENFLSYLHFLFQQSLMELPQIHGAFFRKCMFVSTASDSLLL